MIANRVFLLQSSLISARVVNEKIEDFFFHCFSQSPVEYYERIIERFQNEVEIVSKPSDGCGDKLGVWLKEITFRVISKFLKMNRVHFLKTVKCFFKVSNMCTTLKREMFGLKGHFTRIGRGIYENYTNVVLRFLEKLRDCIVLRIVSLIKSECSKTTFVEEALEIPFSFFDSIASENSILASCQSLLSEMEEIAVKNSKSFMTHVSLCPSIDLRRRFLRMFRTPNKPILLSFEPSKRDTFIGFMKTNKGNVDLQDLYEYEKRIIFSIQDCDEGKKKKKKKKGIFFKKKKVVIPRVNLMKVKVSQILTCYRKCCELANLYLNCNFENGKARSTYFAELEMLQMKVKFWSSLRREVDSEVCEKATQAKTEDDPSGILSDDWSLSTLGDCESDSIETFGHFFSNKLKDSNEIPANKDMGDILQQLDRLEQVLSMQQLMAMCLRAHGVYTQRQTRSILGDIDTLQIFEIFAFFRVDRNSETRDHKIKLEIEKRVGPKHLQRSIIVKRRVSVSSMEGFGVGGGGDALAMLNEAKYGFLDMEAIMGRFPKVATLPGNLKMEVEKYLERLTEVLETIFFEKTPTCKYSLKSLLRLYSSYFITFQECFGGNEYHKHIEELLFQCCFFSFPGHQETKKFKSDIMHKSELEQRVKVVLEKVDSIKDLEFPWEYDESGGAFVDIFSLRISEVGELEVLLGRYLDFFVQGSARQHLVKTICGICDVFLLDQMSLLHKTRSELLYNRLCFNKLKNLKFFPDFQKYLFANISQSSSKRIATAAASMAMALNEDVFSNTVVSQQKGDEGESQILQLVTRSLQKNSHMSIPIHYFLDILSPFRFVRETYGELMRNISTHYTRQKHELRARISSLDPKRIQSVEKLVDYAKYLLYLGKFDFADGDSFPIFLNRLCPWCKCMNHVDFVNSSKERDSKHVQCRKCKKLYCHICLGVPRGPVLYSDGELSFHCEWDCGRKNAKCSGNEDGHFGMYPLQTSRNIGKWMRK